MKFLKWLWGMYFGGPPAPTPGFITDAQMATVKACGFLPQASSIASIIGAMTGQAAAAATAVGVASTICKAVSVTRSMGLVSGEPPKPVVIIDGVEIVVEGKFVE